MLPHQPGGKVQGHWDLLLVALTLASTVAFLWHGAGFVLDDWFTLRNAHFDGIAAVPGAGPGAARPGSYVVFGLVFGVFGLHPLPSILFIASCNAASAVLLRHLLARFVPDRWALLTAGLWVVVPTRTSTEFWVTCALHAVSTVLLLGALSLVARDIDSWRFRVIACALLAASCLVYEATLPLALLGSVLVPSLVRRRLDLRFAAGAAVVGGLVGLWVVTHWFSGKSVKPIANVGHLLNVNFGWGLTPGAGANPLARVLVLAVLLGSAVALVLLYEHRGRGPLAPAGWMIVTGYAVMLAGFAPFVRYYYEPQGAGDRVNYLSSIGGVLVLVGLLALLSSWRPQAWVPVAVLLVVMAVPARVERIELWSTAGLDAERIRQTAVRQHPDARRIVIGPKPIVEWNVTAYLDASNIDGAVDLAFDREEMIGEVSYADDDAWKDVPSSEQVDIWPVSELDGMGP